MTRHPFKFTAKYEDGRECVIHGLRMSAPAASRGDPGGVARDTKYTTAGGQTVTRLGDGKYRIDATGELLVSDDPMAS